MKLWYIQYMYSNRWAALIRILGLFFMLNFDLIICCCVGIFDYEAPQLCWGRKVPVSEQFVCAHPACPGKDIIYPYI